MCLPGSVTIFFHAKRFQISDARVKRVNQKSLLDDSLRTFARKFSNFDFFLKTLPLKDDDLVMSEM